MPLSEFYRSINGNNESSQQKSTDVSYIPNDEFVELIWEKGQIMMQGQSSKAKKAPVSSNFQYQTPKVQEKSGLLDVAIPEIGLNQDDDMVPWLNYPLDDYYSDFLPEISGVTVHEPPLYNGMNVIEKKVNKDPNSTAVLDQPNASKGSRNSHVFSFSDPTGRSGVSDKGNSSCRSRPQNVIHRDPVGRIEKTAQKQDQLPPHSTTTVLNFSHFSRPAAMAKANANANANANGNANANANGLKHDQNVAVNVVNHGPQKELGFVGQPSLDSVKVSSNPLTSKPLEEPHCVEKSSNDANGGIVGPETVKSNEPVGASSSVCSGNSAERASNDLTRNSKRKSHDVEDFECESQDVEEESLSTKKAGGSRSGSGSKRSRAAEVHNLSERRRRDRINEKMRALQELIPNCNKVHNVDKASMLDEAIEYLKTLQLQVQIMSMGTGLYMPPMMFPGGMQHMHPAHFSPMGMSYGMGMGMEMNGGQHMFSFSPNAQGSRHGHPLPSPPVYGHPSQGMPMFSPQQPMPGIPMNPAVRQTGPQVEVQDVGPSSKDPMQNKNPNAMTPTSNQPQVANKSLNQSTSVDRKD